MGTQMTTEATTPTDQTEQGQAVVDEMIDSFGDPIDTFAELPPDAAVASVAETSTSAVEPAAPDAPVQPTAGEVIPPVATPTAPGGGEGVTPAQAGTQAPVSFPDELLTLSGLSEQQARDAFGTPDKLFQVLGQAKRQQGQFTLPPTGRQGKALTPDERAHAAVRKFLADRGEPVPQFTEGPDEV